MSTLFSDDFNRADGAPGNGWTVATGTWDILSNTLRCHTNGARIYRAVPTGAEYDLMAQLAVTSLSTYSGSYPLRFFVRSDSGGSNYYRVVFTPGAMGSASVEFTKWVSGSSDSLATYYTFALTTGTHTLAVQCVGTTITALVDGVQVGAVTDSTHPSGGYVQLVGLGVDQWRLDDFAIYDSQSSQMYVVPSSVVPGATGLTLTLLGVGTAWTPGTPGDPEFTVSAGTITGQTIEAADRAVLTYDSPTTPQFVTITDPNYGRTCLLTVSNGVVLPPGGGSDPFGLYAFLQGLHNALVELLNTSAEALFDGETVVEGESVLQWVRRIGVPPQGETLASMLVTVLRELQVDGDNPTTIRSVLVDLFAELYTTNGYPNRVTLPEILAAVGGGGGSHQDILDAIAAVSALLTTTLAEVYTLDGYPTPVSTPTILSAVQAIQSALDALSAGQIAAIQAALVAVGADVDNMNGDGSSSLPAITAAIQSMRGAALHTLDGTWDRADAAANSAAAAVTAIGLVAGTLALLPAAIGALLAAQTAELVAAMAVQTAEINAATAAEAFMINGNIAGVSGQVTDVKGVVDQIWAEFPIHAGELTRYPGSAGVTKGTPVAITTDMTIAGPIDGALYEVTAAPARLNKTTVGGYTSWLRLGKAAFLSDDGYLDSFQTVNWDHGMLLPRQLLTPASLVLRWETGVTGWVIPWVRTIP